MSPYDVIRPHWVKSQFTSLTFIDLVSFIMLSNESLLWIYRIPFGPYHMIYIYLITTQYFVMLFPFSIWYRKSLFSCTCHELEFYKMKSLSSNFTISTNIKPLLVFVYKHLFIVIYSFLEMCNKGHQIASCMKPPHLLSKQNNNQHSLYSWWWKCNYGDKLSFDVRIKVVFLWVHYVILGRLLSHFW